MNRFDELEAIIGSRLAEVVCQKMAGKLIRVRKSLIALRDRYNHDPEHYNRMTVVAAAKELGCSVSAMMNYRRAFKASLDA